MLFFRFICTLTLLAASVIMVVMVMTSGDDDGADEDDCSLVQPEKPSLPSTPTLLPKQSCETSPAVFHLLLCCQDTAG